MKGQDVDLDAVYDKFGVDYDLHPFSCTGSRTKMAGFISAGDSRKLRRRYDMNTYKTVKLYLQNWEYADENGQQEDYRASLKANIACKEAVEAAIVKHYHVNGYTLDTKN